MLKTEINELLTQSGPGTATGDFFRQYWIPALLAEELPENDCPLVRVKILSERLIAFRDTEGRYGLSTSSVRTAAHRAGSAASRSVGSAAPITDGSTTSRAAALPRRPARRDARARQLRLPVRPVAGRPRERGACGPAGWPPRAAPTSRSSTAPPITSMQLTPSPPQASRSS